MPKHRSYRLLCPIARALDAIGDRWALLILRDLHAGPARYQELQNGLGIATNLLSTRLAELTAAGLIHKPETGRSAYELTALGRRTDTVLSELAKFGGLLDPTSDPREPGNLRTMALPLRIMFGSVTPRTDLVLRLLVNDDSFTIRWSSTGVDVDYGESRTTPHLTARVDYFAFLELGEGRMSPSEFVANHLEIIDGNDYRGDFLSILASAMTNLARAS